MAAFLSVQVPAEDQIRLKPGSELCLTLKAQQVSKAALGRRGRCSTRRGGGAVAATCSPDRDDMRCAGAQRALRVLCSLEGGYQCACLSLSRVLQKLPGALWLPSWKKQGRGQAVWDRIWFDECDCVLTGCPMQGLGTGTEEWPQLRVMEVS